MGRKVVKVYSMHVAALALAILALPALDSAQAPLAPGKVSVLQSRILDLVLRIEDMGGKVQELDVKETATEVRIDLAADVLFDFDKSEILPKAQQTLAQAAQVIRKKAKGTVRIEGYTDAKGSDPYNQKLSDQRATSVKAWFVNKEKLRNVSFETQGFGVKNPIASNTKPDGSDNPDGRQKNRRVEIIIRK
jgi:outer membrane protein OmpA-like peptidoglycan-associated protein